jgi:hypothetical protein
VAVTASTDPLPFSILYVCAGQHLPLAPGGAAHVSDYVIADPSRAVEALHAQVADPIDASVTALVRALATTVIADR